MIATSLRTSIRRLPLNIIFCVALTVGALIALATSASAQVSANVRNACMGDYFEYCAGMEVGSQELRRCFNRNGAKLSGGCVKALIGAGEVSQAEVNRRGGVPSATRTASKPRPSAKRIATRSSCVAGPSRPGARSMSTCRNVASSGRRGARQYARN